MVHATGVQSEMELAFAGLQQLCSRCWITWTGCRVRRARRCTPVRQRRARPFLVGLAVLSLLSDAAGEQPLIGLVDDQQWLDDASAQALGFAVRAGTQNGGPGLRVGARAVGRHGRGCRSSWSRACGRTTRGCCWDSVLTGPLDARVRDRIVAETRGNPLALLELPRGSTPAELAGGFGFLARHRSRRGSRTASDGGCGVLPARRGGC